MTKKVSSLHSDEEINKINKVMNPDIVYVSLREYYDKLIPHVKTMSFSVSGWEDFGEVPRCLNEMSLINVFVLVNNETCVASLQYRPLLSLELEIRKDEEGDGDGPWTVRVWLYGQPLHGLSSGRAW